MIWCNMHLRLVDRRLSRGSLQQCMFALLLFTTACVSASVDSQFDVVAKRKLFVDRSLLIQHLFGKMRIHPWIADHHIIIGARKSGKSTNLSMMKQFFGVQVDERGRVLFPNSTKHYALFKSLKIGRWPMFEQCFALIPVIHLNLADFVVNGSEKDFKKSFCKVLRDLMTEHRYVFQNIGEHDYVKKRLGSYRDEETCQKQDILQLEYCGHDLISLMHDHFKARVFVLVDEIDAPAMSILDSNVTSVNIDFIDHVFCFARRMIKDNTNDVMGSFLTGTTMQGAINGEMCVFKHYAFEKDLKYFYGVTEDEVRRLLSISGIPPTATLMRELRDMYGGCGITDEENKEFVYSTQSILKFCEGRVIKPYWDGAAGIAPFKRLLSPEQAGGSVEKAMYGMLGIRTFYDGSAEALRRVKDVLLGKNVTLTFLWWSMEGYLWESGFFANYPGKRSAYRSWQVTVPNNENHLILLDTVLNDNYYMAKHGVNKKLVYDFVTSVAKLDARDRSFDQLADSVLNLFAKGMKDLNDEAVFRYPLYNYLRQADKGLFSKVTAELGRKTQRKSDIVVTLKDGSEVFMGLTLDKESGLDALRQVLEDEQLQKGGKTMNGKFFALGINLLRSESRFDVSYLVNSLILKDARNVTRPIHSAWAKISNRAKSSFRRATS